MFLEDMIAAVNKIIENNSAFGGGFRPNSLIKDDLGIDSLKIVELIVNLEEEFNIMLDEADLDPDKLIEVADLYMLIEKYL